MAPRSSASDAVTSSVGSKNKRNPDKKTHVSGPLPPSSSGISTFTDTARNSPSFIRCDSTDSYVVLDTRSPEEVNASLNLNLGQTWINPDHTLLRQVIRFLNTVLLAWWEVLFFRLWKLVPLSVRKGLTFTAWHLYLPLHKLLLKNTTAIHPDASEEYHALSTFLWWGRLFPVTVRRMRFALSQLSVCRRDSVETENLERIECDMMTSSDRDFAVPSVQREHTTVRGTYIQCNQDDLKEYSSDRQVIFWLYGGAFLSGCVEGNLGPANAVGRASHKDVFLPEYRLLPEASFDDMLWDVCVSYRWLVQVRGVKPENIVLFGISSGAGLCTRLLQFLGEVGRKEVTEPEYLGPVLLSSSRVLPKPSGAVLMCPFVDYTEPKGTLAVYPAHDLIVNQSVTELGFPYLEKTLGNHENRTKASPVHRSFQDLPPLCVVVSEHEAVYDQALLLVNRARKQHVSVSLGVWKYTCHVFCFLDNFIPEGEQSMQFVCNWISEHFKNKKD